MRVRIHRGTKQIGGTCIEIESGGQRVLLDLGRPLDAAPDVADLLPAVPGLQTGGSGLLAILLSHPHQDHVGLVELTHSSIPVAIGDAASKILDRAAVWLGRPLLESHPLIHWKDRQTVDIGPFRVTPYLVDHSAYDAYALLVEADGQRLFYSGDFRGHGRKAKLFEALVSNPPQNIDVLLMEGTVIGRDAEHRKFPSEKDLEPMFVERIRAAGGMTLVWTSSQNIDRIVTVFRAARRTGKRLILDAFTAEMLDATGNTNLPQADWGANIGVYVPEWMRRKIKRDGSFEVLDRFSANRVFLDRLADPANEILLFRPGMMREVAASAPLTGAQVLYSNWSGYLEDPSTSDVRAWLEGSGIPLHRIHTSGHASVPDLQRFAAAIAARSLVPIHSFETSRFPELFANVTMKDDGKWWGVTSAPSTTTTRPSPRRSEDSDYLKVMEAYATALRALPDYDPAAWASKDRYVRVNGAGVRPISISQENPCGKLRLANRVVENLRESGMDRLAGIIESASPATATESDGVPLWRRKKELRVQAWIIKEALAKPEGLRDLLHLGDACDDVRFVTDELALNDIRADIVLLASKGDAWFPVFVELKAVRNCKRVVEQLKNITKVVTEGPSSAPFRDFLAASTGIHAAKIALDQWKQLMIWPALKSRASKPQAKIPGEIRVLEFNLDVLEAPPDKFAVTFAVGPAAH